MIASLHMNMDAVQVKGRSLIPRRP